MVNKLNSSRPGEMAETKYSLETCVINQPTLQDQATTTNQKKVSKNKPMMKEIVGHVCTIVVNAVFGVGCYYLAPECIKYSVTELTNMMVSLQDNSTTVHHAMEDSAQVNCARNDVLTGQSQSMAGTAFQADALRKQAIMLAPMQMNAILTVAAHMIPIWD